MVLYVFPMEICTRVMGSQCRISGSIVISSISHELAILGWPWRCKQYGVTIPLNRTFLKDLKICLSSGSIRLSGVSAHDTCIAGLWVSVLYLYHSPSTRQLHPCSLTRYASLRIINSPP